MNKFLERFGIFDVFAMLIPGVFFEVGSMLLFPSFIQKMVHELPLLTEGAAKYFLFFTVSYFVGVIYHEIGNFFEKRILKIFGINHEKNFLLSKKKRVHGKVDFVIFRKVRDDLYKKCVTNEIKQELEENEISEEDINRFALHYCMTFLESENLISKAEKMQSIAEMSRSLYLMCFTLLAASVWRINDWRISLILLVMTMIFIARKRRFEEFRTDIIMRNYYIYQQKQENSKEKRSSRGTAHNRTNHRKTKS